ncbi:prepilin-type N-terminal cleavage/methylation domain-containing protein [Candidatus Shapirobacteria bacterium]|nr:prepilin-type N-terminal cleavage/methylation domain-containing protein [Candidatus Shapirobacteria bacterium]
MRRGFTLIEIIVVVGVIGLIMAAVTSILINTTRAKTRIELTDAVEASGNLVMSQIKNDVFNALGEGMTCPSTGTNTISFVNVGDGEVTTLSCYEGQKIASESAKGNYDLTSADVAVSGCNNFVSCDYYAGTTDKISKVKFTFGLTAGQVAEGGEHFVSRKFQSDVVTRN